MNSMIDALSQLLTCLEALSAEVSGVREHCDELAASVAGLLERGAQLIPTGAVEALLRHPRWDWQRMRGLPVLVGGAPRAVIDGWPTPDSPDVGLDLDQATTARLLATLLHESAGGAAACGLLAAALLQTWGDP